MRSRILSAIGGVFALGMGCSAVNAGALPNLLTFNPGVLGFPATAVGSTVSPPSALEISNLTPNYVTITSVTVIGHDAGDFSFSPGYCPLSPNSLYPYESCNPAITFSPKAVGLRVANLVVSTAGGAPQTVVLTGEGLRATKTISFSVPQATFPDTPLGVSPPSAPQALIEVLSSGTQYVKIESVTLGGAAAGDFAILANSCTSTPLAPGGFCSVNVSFVPTASGVRAATLQFVDDAAGGAQVLPLVGVGGTPENLLQLFPVAVAFAPTGSASSEVTQLTVQNVGSTSVTINGVVLGGPNASDFSLIQNYCQPIPYTLAVQAQCDMQIQFAPGGLGTRVANLHIVDSASGSPQLVPLQGLGITVPINLSFSSSPYDAGTVTVGYSSYQQIYLNNNGSQDVQISLQLQGPDPGDFYFSNFCPSPLTPGDYCYIPITFAPSATGIRVASLVATDTISGHNQSVLLVGSGLASGTLLSLGYPAPTFFSEVVGSTSPSTYIYLDNYGGSNVTLTGINVTGGAASDFKILVNGCPPLFNSFSECTIQIGFTPSAVGPRVAELQVNYSGQPGPFTVPLAGSGLPSTRTIGFNMTELNLGPQPLGTSYTGSVMIQSIGHAAVGITNVSIAGPDAQDYTITDNQCPHAPATLGAGGSCQVTVQFSPSALGSRIATLSVTDNATGSPQGLALVGFGSNTAPALLLSPASLSFNPEPLGSNSQQTISVSAMPGSSVSLTGIQVIGPNASDFTIATNCGPVVTSTACDVYVTFTPSVTGLRVAELQLQDDAVGSPQIIPLAGMGLTATASISLLPSPLTVPTPQPIGNTGTANLILQNTGSRNVGLTAFHIGGRNASEFSIMANTCPINPTPLPPGQACQLTIAFKPLAVGVRLATLSVGGNATGSPQSISIVGQGVLPLKELQVSPASLSFPTISEGSSYTEFVYVYSVGNAAVTFSGFTITGANASDFSLGFNECSGSLSPGYNCYVYVNFMPTATGTRSAAFNIASDATGSPLVVPLTGTGE